MVLGEPWGKNLPSWWYRSLAPAQLLLVAASICRQTDLCEAVAVLLWQLSDQNGETLTL